MNFYLFGGLVAFIVILAFVASRRGRYRGAIGFKNRHRSEIAECTLSGFSSPVSCRSLPPGGHSFNFLGRQIMPREVHLEWQAVGEPEVRRATLILDSVPQDATDGELFFVLESDGAWRVEFSPELRVDRLS